jgi:hypothetical protein
LLNQLHYYQRKLVFSTKEIFSFALILGGHIETSLFLDFRPKISRPKRRKPRIFKKSNCGHSVLQRRLWYFNRDKTAILQVVNVLGNFYAGLS